MHLPLSEGEYYVCQNSRCTVWVRSFPQCLQSILRDVLLYRYGWSGLCAHGPSGPDLQSVPHHCGSLHPRADCFGTD